MSVRDKNIHTFIGCDNGYDESNIVIFGAPFDGTTSYRPGARFAPSVMRNESIGIETYSPYQDKDLEDYNIFDGGDLEMVFGNPSKNMDIIEEYVSSILNDNKIPCMIGGEHLVTLGAFRAVYNKYKDIHVIHFDAHADLRDDYMGEKLSHATVIRRVWELAGDNRIYQFGIRSGERSEFEFAKSHTFLNKFNMDNLDKIVEELKGRQVYLTIDLDVLDSSIFSGTGTPEAGGINFNELVSSIMKLKDLDIKACDINELAPMLDASGGSTAAACKTLREVLLLIAK